MDLSTNINHNGALLKVQNLKKHYPVRTGNFPLKREMIQAVCGVSFTVQQGKTLALVGESGSGKTTVARLIMRLEQPDDGEVYFEGENILTCNAPSGRRLRRDIQMIFQDPYSSLNPHKTVNQIIGEPLRIHALCSKNDLPENIKMLLASVGLSADIIRNYPHEFSGGQRQRIGIARALAVNPKLIICDEPVSALDVSIRAQILNLLVDLQKNRALTYIFIGHDLSVVKYISDQVAVMYMGKIVELADTNEFYENPLHPYSDALLSATPITSPEQRKGDVVVSADTPSAIKPPTGCRFHTRCKLAERMCAEKEPQFAEISENHSVACHLKS
jgi:oligopeptide/dipeptide ABC transporter ATP-binding protein